MLEHPPYSPELAPGDFHSVPENRKSVWLLYRLAMRVKIQTSTEVLLVAL